MDQLTSKVKIAIADDHAIFRKGLVRLLDTDRFELLFDVGDGKALIENIRFAVPDIVIMDIKMPGMNGYEAVAWLRANHPLVKILVLSTIEDEESVVRMLQLGVKGYLTKIMEPEDLHAALRTILRDEYYFTDIVTNRLIHAVQSGEHPDGSIVSHELWNGLSERQKDFVKYACSEMIYEEIAAKMDLSPKTIDRYRDIVFERFNVRSRVGLVLYAIKHNIVMV